MDELLIMIELAQRTFDNSWTAALEHEQWEMEGKLQQLGEFYENLPMPMLEVYLLMAEGAYVQLHRLQTEYVRLLDLPQDMPWSVMADQLEEQGRPEGSILRRWCR